MKRPPELGSPLVDLLTRVDISSSINLSNQLGMKKESFNGGLLLRLKHNNYRCEERLRAAPFRIISW